MHQIQTMKTISSEVLNYIKTKPFLMSALSQGIINLTSLAREIQPEVEKSLKKSAKNGAIVMALKRISASHCATGHALAYIKGLRKFLYSSLWASARFLPAESFAMPLLPLIRLKSVGSAATRWVLRVEQSAIATEQSSSLMPSPGAATKRWAAPRRVGLQVVYSPTVGRAVLQNVTRQIAC